MRTITKEKLICWFYFFPLAQKVSGYKANDGQQQARALAKAGDGTFSGGRMTMARVLATTKPTTALEDSGGAQNMVHKAGKEEGNNGNACQKGMRTPKFKAFTAAISLV